MKNLHERAVEAAIRFVERKGYEVLDRNWSCESVAGRLDLVAMDEDAIVFIDVWENPQEGPKYGIQLIPTQIFYDAKGKEVLRHEGFMEKAAIVAELEKLGVK